MKLINALLITYFALCSIVVNAVEYKLPVKGAKYIGQLQYHKVKKGDYFQKIAEHYDIGFLALLSANPKIDPFLPEPGSTILIPSAMLLPYVKREGIVINLPELRLYYFSPNKKSVHVFPVGIGRQGLETPNTISYIGEKRKNPTWRPTQAMIKRYLAQGKVLAREMPAGPNNPFGKYALRLGTSEYLIHGSNQRFGIGMRASSGCIRMYDDDIKWLFDHVPVNTPVRIVNQPIKMSYENGVKQLIEIHAPLSKKAVEEKSEKGKEEYNSRQEKVVSQAVKRFVSSKDIYWQQILPLIDSPQGLVIELGKQ